MSQLVVQILLKAHCLNSGVQQVAWFSVLQKTSTCLRWGLLFQLKKQTNKPLRVHKLKKIESTVRKLVNYDSAPKSVTIPDSLKGLSR